MRDPDPRPVPADDHADPDPVEPRGTDADLAEQVRPVEPGRDDDAAFALPEDPEVPLVDAWEAGQPVVEDEDQRPHDA